MKTVKKVIRYMISILLTILIILLLFTLIVSFTLGHKEYIYQKFDETDYYTKIYEQVVSSFEDYMYQSGLDIKVFENLVSKEKVKKDTNTIISNIFSGINEEIETQSIKDNFNANIDRIMGNNALNITQRKAVDSLIDKLVKKYTDTILHFEYENKINNYYKVIMQYMDIFKKGIIIAIAVCILALIGITTRRIYRIFNFLGISCISSGTFLIIVNIVINTGIKIQKLAILSDAMSEVIRSILTQILNIITLSGCTLIAVGIISIVLTNLIHNWRKYA